jgi:hypothetical protein
MIRGTMAYGHRWLGEQLLLTNGAAEARGHLMESLRWQWSCRAAGLYVLSLLPGGVTHLLRRVAHLARRTRHNVPATDATPAGGDLAYKPEHN